MLIIGCDFHAGFHRSRSLTTKRGGARTETGTPQEAILFYRPLAGQQVRVGIEAGAPYPWFEQLLAEWGFELWLGDAARSGRRRCARRRRTSKTRRFCTLCWGEAVSADLGTDAARARRAAATGTPAQASTGADGGEEPIAGHGDKPGNAEEAKAMDGSGAAEGEKWELLPYTADGGSSCCKRWRSGSGDRAMNRRVEEEAGNGRRR